MFEFIGEEVISITTLRKQHKNKKSLLNWSIIYRSEQLYMLEQFYITDGNMIMIKGLDHQGDIVMPDSNPASLTIEVLSSQSRVTVTVDGATVGIKFLCRVDC